MTDETRKDTTDAQASRERVLAFAQQVGSPETPPEDTARTRGWIDEAGEITEAGREVLDSLGDQQGTRSVFR